MSQEQLLAPVGDLVRVFSPASLSGSVWLLVRPWRRPRREDVGNDEVLPDEQ